MSKNKMGRPEIAIDKDDFEGLCRINCDLYEIKSFFKCSDDTLQRFCKKTYNKTFAGAYEDFAGEGRIAIRRAQFKVAVQQNNVPMLKYLGEVVLKQRTVQAIEISGPDQKPIQVHAEIDYDSLPLEDLFQLKAILQRACNGRTGSDI